MSQLDDLVARSRSPGHFVERKRFTLSREKAIEKQREFALRHPKQYVLELVQAAVFAGATYIAIDARSHSTLVAWVGGTPLADRELENLLDYLFADRGDARWRHLVQLAVGVNAILQRKPRLLRLETGDGKRSVRMDLDETSRAQLGTVEDPIAGTYLYAEFGGGWLSRFTASKHTEEQALVEERCLYTPVPILLNGAAPFGYRGSHHIEIFGARKQVHFDEGGRRGVVAVHASERAATGFRIVVGGVWVTTLPLAPLASRPLVGVICDDALRKTADHSDIVQDHRYVEMLHAVQPRATQLMTALDGARYRPPDLPPIPHAARPSGPAPGEVALEPLPEVMRAVPPRTALLASQLDALFEATDKRTPLFWCPPDVVSELIAAADPARFPYRVLVLTPGQAGTLEARLPNVALHRLASKGDVEFVRRVLDRQVRVREHRFEHEGSLVRLSLHLEGPLPDWGSGPGVPFAVVRDDATELTGTIEGDRVVPAASRGAEVPTAWSLGTPLRLPRTSVLIEGPATVDDALVSAVLDEAWRLAVPEAGEPDGLLLAALLGHVAVPQLVSGPPLAVAANLPPRFPDALRHVPLVQTTTGALSLAGYLARLGTDEVLEVTTADGLAAMEDLEWRFGFGHLTHPSLDDKPLLGVGRFNGRWVWLDKAALWGSGGMTQTLFVAGSLAPRVRDGRWLRCEGPSPEIVAIRREDAEDADWDKGYELLFRRLAQVDADDAWSELPLPAGIRRARGMGRLALLHLAATLGHRAAPLLLPSDGGARASLDQLCADPAVRVAARNGVEVTEPRTFLLTRDELRAISPGAGHHEGALALRYDDDPEVWRSLVDGPDTGWLLRTEVRVGGLSGWLGLRHPYDGTTGILVRTTGRLVALPELDRRIPCHGLLRPDGGARSLTVEQTHLLQLAGLRLYQEVCALLRSGRLDPDRAETARQYGFAFAELAHRRRRLSGTALELARAVEVRDPATGLTWGTLEQWLGTGPEHRPPRPPGLAVLDGDEVAARDLASAEGSEDLGALQTRLHSALERAGLAARLQWVPGSPAIQVVEGRSTHAHVVLALDPNTPMVAAAAARPGRERELVLLEAARLVAVWAQTRGLPVDLLEVQQILLAQRLDLS